MKLSILPVLASFSFALTSADDAIFDGVKNDDGAAIQTAVENDPSALESIGQGGQTPLIHAVLTGKLNAVKTLLDIGADTLATERDGYNVLHAAGFQGRAEILQVLLQHFADQKKSGGAVLDPSTDKHKDGFYPLHVSETQNYPSNIVFVLFVPFPSSIELNYCIILLQLSGRAGDGHHGTRIQ